MVIGWIGLFAISLVVALASSLLLARVLDRIGTRLRCTDAIIGVLTALGADSPEISTAAVAVFTHQTDIGVGVVLGSNVFNLAGLVATSALITGTIRVGRLGVLLEGIPAMLITFLAVALVVFALPAWIAIILVLAVLTPYLWLSSIQPERLRSEGSNSLWRRLLLLATTEEEHDATPDHHEPPATRRDMLFLIPTLALVVASSIGMVEAAQHLGDRWHVSPAITGTLVLAMLTSIPNALAAIRLSLHGRGPAVVAETFNSNSANILAGLCLPAAILGLGTVSHQAELTAWWLLLMTAATVGLLWLQHGLNRTGATIIVLSYATFVILILTRA